MYLVEIDIASLLCRKWRSHPGPLTDQRVMNIDHSFDIYELIEREAHKDMVTITLRPMLYRDTSKGVERAEPIMFDSEGDRTLFLETVNVWMVKHGFNPEVDLTMQVFVDFMEGVTWEPMDDQHIVRACKSIALN